MLETLKQKLLSWTPESSNAFYNNVVRYGNHSGKIWEKTGTGVFLYSAQCASYYDLNGNTYELKYGDWTNTLEFQQQVSDYCSANSLMNLERPTLIETHYMFNRIPYTYVEKQNPVATRGIPGLNAMFETPANFRENLLNGFKAQLAGVRDLIAAVDAITESESSSKYPDFINPRRMALDPATNVWFWSGNIQFTRSRSETLSAMYNVIDVLIPAHASAGGVASISTEIQNFVSTECTIFQRP